MPLPSQPNVLLLKSKNDHNGALANSAPEHEWLSSLFPGIRCVHLTPAGNVNQLLQQCQRKGKYHLLLVRAHGMQHSMSLYQSCDMEVRALSTLVHKTTHPESIVVLDSFRTGTTHGRGLAKTLSEIHPDRWIVAPAVSSSYIGFERAEDHLVVRMYNDLAQRIERVFQNGRLVSSPFKESPPPIEGVCKVRFCRFCRHPLRKCLKI